ncbi:alpha/beta-hydrolase, partial [Rhizodiscina lignyota]
TNAQFPPRPKYTAVIKSPVDSNITISYRTPDPGTCTTIFPSQKQYSGYVNIPPHTLAPIQQGYSINTFFWFFESRVNPETAPLTIYLNGGPGSSSMVGLFQEVGPCEVVQLADGSYGTQARMWGWDRTSNLLFFDQPAQVGLSYDRMTNGSYNLTDGEFTTPPKPLTGGLPAFTFLNGTFGSDNGSSTANTTQIAAHAVWHFLQGFLSAFPQYNPGVDENATTVNPTGINLFTESYGGVYGPVFSELFEDKNQQRLDGTISENATLEIALETLGIINGLVEQEVQNPFYSQFAYNNTFGIQAITQTEMLNTLAQLNGEGGCQQQLQDCRRRAAAMDPGDEGDDIDTNFACYNAQMSCLGIQSVYQTSNRSVYDIRQANPNPFPSLAYIEYLNNASVQASIGAGINYTESNELIYQVFWSTGDMIRSSQLTSLAALLARGIRIAFIYGDADYICNWMGGEAVSLALAQQNLPSPPGEQYPAYIASPYATKFPQAGYADVVTNSSYVGGAVRQYGNLSFTRVYDAGHLVAAYQPETAFTLFTRIIQGVDISTGQPIDPNTWSSQGPANATHDNSKTHGSSNLGAQPTCWIRGISSSCTEDQQQAILQGQGSVVAGVWYPEQDDFKAPSTTIQAGSPGSPVNVSFGTETAGGTSSSSDSNEGTSVVGVVGAQQGDQPTGVYVATGTPKSDASAPGERMASIAIVLIGFWTSFAVLVGVMVM